MTESNEATKTKTQTGVSPYVKKNAGDLIKADDWNQLQIDARKEIRGHKHTGDEDGTPIPTKGIAKGAVTKDRLHADVVSELSAGLADGVVTTRKIADGAVTKAKLHAEVVKELGAQSVPDDLKVKSLSVSGDSYLAGRIGIGTTSPGTKLNIKNNGEQLYLEQSNVDNGWKLTVDNADGYLKFKRRGEGRSPTDNTSVTITTNGNVGIGTASPGTKLEVNGDLKSGSIHSRPQVFSFKVGGDFDKFYPVVFADDNWGDGPMILEINRPSVHTDSEWRGSLNSKFTCHGTAWGHGADFCRAEIYWNRASFIAGYTSHPRGTWFIVWLRGGGTTYFWRSNHFVTMTDCSASQKNLKVRDDFVYPVKTKLDSYVSTGVRFDKNLCIDGNVGIGTTAPNRHLTIEGATGTYMNVRAQGGTYEVLLGADSSGGIVSTMTKHDLQLRAGGNKTFMIVKGNGRVGIGTTAPNRHLTIEGEKGTYMNVRAQGGTYEVLLGADSRGGIVSTMTNHDLQLRAGGNKTFMVIKGNGNVGIGTVSPAAKLEVIGVTKTDKLRLANKWILSGVGDKHANDDWLRLFKWDGSNYYGGLAAGRLWSSSGTLSGSDIRLKENVKTLGKSLKKLLSLRGVSFRWKDNARKSPLQIGLVAQEVEKIFPELVEVGPDGMKSLNYSGLIAPIIEAVKELKAENEGLKRRTEVLEMSVTK